MKKILYIVVPCYNEEEVLPVTNGMFTDKLESLYQSGKISRDSRVLFVNDGSKDNTWEIIKSLSDQNEYIEGMIESRNEYIDNSIAENKNEIVRLKSRFRKIEQCVMESKKFEGFVLIGIILFYAYLGLHIGFWIVRAILG